MGNVFRTQAQREHWNEYNKNYANKNYTAFTMKFSKVKDADVIEFLTSHDGLTTTQIIRNLIRSLKK